MSRGDRSQPSHQRTDEERERDRLEREQRRAQREGAQRPPLPDPEPPLRPVSDSAPAADPAPIPDPAPISEPAAVPIPQPTAAPDPDHAPLTDELLAIPPAEIPPAGLPPAIPPPGGVGSGRGRGPRRAPAGREPSAHRRSTRARVAALVALVLAAALVWFLISLFEPFAGEGSGRVIVTIPKGSSASKVGSILAREGVVSSGFFFDLRALVEGKRGSLHSGRFELKHDMSYSAAIDALSKPPPKVITLKVVIPEGYTRRQIADLVQEDALSGDYLAASASSPLLNPRHYGAPKSTRTLEGFLFPATYELRAGAPAQRLVNEQLVAFRRRFGPKDIRRAHALGVTPYELLTVASLVEREAQTEHDRPLIAAVIYNRLREGIPIGIDAAIYYAVEQRMGIATYTGELTASQLKIDSPYNTRTHKGLPPTPISNPGEASIEAAAHPAHKPYLYYVAGADGCGEQVFSKTEAEFEKNVAAYDAAVKKNGGHPPKCKKK
ncbi:MAG TPA: endolytic transglycosylase MltG [Solirubrobacteraceae bacterium]|nr:endolytic transglycosylase MltG [Solirubrobacteraceae bacterium]